MQDFDTPDGDVSERQFKVGGQVFTVRQRIHPSAMQSLDMDANDSITETMDALAKMIRSCLVFADRERWDAALLDSNDDANIITIEQIKDVSDFVLEKLTGDRPLVSPVSSGDSMPTIAPPSLAAVSSPEAATQTS